MRTITKAALALGFIGAMAASAFAPTKAQGVYFSGPGVEVQVGDPEWRYRHHRRYYRTTMAPMHTLLLRAIGLGTDVLGATQCRMASVSHIAVINRKSSQREAALSWRPLSLVLPELRASESPHVRKVPIADIAPIESQLTRSEIGLLNIFSAFAGSARAPWTIEHDCAGGTKLLFVLGQAEGHAARVWNSV